MTAALSPGLSVAIDCLDARIARQKLSGGTGLHAELDDLLIEHGAQILKYARDELADLLAAAEIREHGLRRADNRERAGSQYGEAS